MKRSDQWSVGIGQSGVLRVELSVRIQVLGFKQIGYRINYSYIKIIFLY